MTVMITIPWFIPAYKAGGPVQSIANLVNNFDDNIQYRIFCGDTETDGIPLKEAAPDKWVSYNHNTLVWYSPKKKVRKTIISQASLLKPDILFIIGLFDLYFNIMPLFFCRASKKILSVRGMLHPGALTQKAFKKKVFISVLKLSGITKKICFHATDDAEAGFIKKEFGNSVKIYTARNYGNWIAGATALQKEKGSLKLVTVALISPMKNHDLVLQALAHCADKIEYHIYGPVKDVEYYNHCKELSLSLPKNIRVIFHGDIPPQKVHEALSKSHVFIMPSKSENFGHAIYEALSACLPVITSNNTPWNNLFRDHAGINTTTEPAALKESIDFFASMDDISYQQFCKGAESYALQKTDSAATAEQYREMFSPQ